MARASSAGNAVAPHTAVGIHSRTCHSLESTLSRAVHNYLYRLNILHLADTSIQPRLHLKP